jgi:outer membrane protein TolC
MLISLSLAYALTLEEAWQIADHDSDDAALIDGQAAATATIRGQAASALLPRVSLSGGYTINQYETELDFTKALPDSLKALIGESDPVVINKGEFWSGSLTVIQPLFSGQALPGWLAAQATARGAEAQAEASHAQLRLGVTRVYWGALLARERRAMLADAVERAEKYASLAEVRERVGAGRGIDTAQAAVALARARRELVLADAARVEAEENLARLLGVNASVTLERPTPQELGVDTVEDAVSAATSGPTVRAASERATAARHVRTATDLGWVPNVNGRFTEAYSENSGFSGEPWNWQIAVMADWQLFDGGYRIAKEQEAAHNARVATVAEQREREQAEADARTLWAQWKAAREARALAIEEHALAERALKLAEASYELGALTFLDLWATRQQRDGAALGELAADMQLDVASVSLQARIGRG